MPSLADRFMRDPGAVTIPISSEGTDETPRTLMDRFQRGQRISEGAPTLGDEFQAGLAQGTDSLQLAMHGVTRMFGRELGLESIERLGQEGIDRNTEEIRENPLSVGSIADIEDTGDFFKWAAGGLGQALPSLASTIAGGGLGGLAAKKGLELSLKRSAVNRITRDLAAKGIPQAQARAAGVRAMNGEVGKKLLVDSIVRPGFTGRQLAASAFGRGAVSGAVAAGAGPIAGQTDIELQEAGVGGTRSALTALTTGVLGGGLEALPALRLLDKLFPGVDREVSKAFVSDMAKGIGAQAALEGSTEAAQEIIQMSALAFHDPTFDPFSEDSQMRLLDAFAIGALVGGVTGGGAEVINASVAGGEKLTESVNRRRQRALEMPEVEVGDQITDPDFEPADNTFFEEVQGRVRKTTSDLLNPILNSVRNIGQSTVNKTREAVGNAMDGELGRLVTALKAGHEDFVRDNKVLIDRVTKFSNDSARAIYEQAQSISDPVARQQFVSEQMESVKSEIERVAQILRRKAARKEEDVSRTVDDMDLNLDDDLEIQDTQDRDIPPANPTQFVFGKNNTGGRQSTLDLFRPDEGEVQGFTTRKAARNLLGSLRERFPSATDATFAINEQDDGTFIVELNDPANAELLMEDDRISRGIERGRLSARRHRNNKRKVKLASGATIDFPSLVFAARDLTDVSTWNEGVQTAASRLLEREQITSEQAQELINRFSSKRDPKLPDKPTDVDQDFDALPPRAKKDINQRVNEQLDDENLRGEPRTERRQELLDQELTEIDLDPRLQRDLGREEQDDEAKFIEEGQGRDLETEDEQARASRSRRPVDKNFRPRVKSFEGEPSKRVYMPGAAKEHAAAAQALLDYVKNKLGLKADIRIINKQGADNMVARGHPHARYAQAMAGAGVGRLIRGSDNGADYAYILLDTKTPAHIQATVLMHELGHLVYHEAFSGLTSDKKKALRAAFVEATRGETGSRVRGRDKFVADEAEFNEWMADQLAAWSNTDQEASGAVQTFLQKVGTQLRALFDFLVKNPRFANMDETYGQFIQAVADRAAGIGTDVYFKNEAQVPGFRLPELKIGDAVTSEIPRTIPANILDRTLQKYETRYPAIVERAMLIRNWVVNAYSIAAAPSNSTLMQIGKRIPAAKKLVRIFGREAHGQAKQSQNYHQRVNLMKGQFATEYRKIVDNLTETEKEILLEAMRAVDGREGATINPNVKGAAELQALFGKMHDYLLNDAGLPIGKIPNYFPRVFSRQKLVDSKEAILAHLYSKGMKQSEAQGFYNSLISQEAEQAAVLRELDKDPLAAQAPAFRNMQSRQLEDRFFDEFLETNLDSVVANYINAATKRGEFNRFLGMNSKTQSGWKARGKYDDILADALEEGATEGDLKFLKQFVDANLGMLGRDFDRALPGARTAMAGMMAYQNMRVLMFTVFASLPDLVGPAIRTGDMRQAFNSTIANIRDAASSQSDLDEQARVYGIVSDQAVDHIFTEYVDNHYMPPQLRKWNEAFFKYTGLQSYTNFTRRMSLAVGKDYIKNQARLTREGATERARDKAVAALKELGLTADNVNDWVGAGEPTWDGAATESNSNQQVAEALVQFVDESIMRPNASQRPLLASHPAAMLVYHLKGYMYALYEVAIRRMAHNFELASTPAQAAAAVAPAIMMMALTAVGLELRELIQYAFSNRTPPSDRMDGWEYTWTLVERTGLLGPGQIAFDFTGADKLGMTGVAAAGGPTLSQFAQVISKPPSQTVPKAIPIIGQIPWARDGLREVTPL